MAAFLSVKEGPVPTPGRDSSLFKMDGADDPSGDPRHPGDPGEAGNYLAPS
jgi:hypothetical protein